MFEGTPYTHFKKEKELSELSADWFWEIVLSGLFYFNFKNIMSPQMPADYVNCGIRDGRRWYLTQYGIICYASELHGYIGRTRISYYNHDTGASKYPRAFLLPYTSILPVKNLHIWFLNRRSKPTLTKAKLWYEMDVRKAKAFYNDPKWKAIDMWNLGRHESLNCINGIYYDESRGIFMIEKVNNSHHYYFEDWLQDNVRMKLEDEITLKRV